MNRIIVLGNPDKPGVEETCRTITTWAAVRGIEIVSNLSHCDPNRQLAGPLDAPQLQRLRDLASGANLAITLGGDGTLLLGVRVVAGLGIPVLAVHLGSLGFHTQAEPAMLPEALERAAAGNYIIQDRLLLETVVTSPTASEPRRRALALNEVVVAKSSLGRAVQLRITVDGTLATDLLADGVMVSTPTGSTGYNFSADGPILAPRLEAIVVGAICPHRINFKPLVLDASSTVEVAFHEGRVFEDAHLLVDGEVLLSLEREDRIKISRAPVYLPLVVFQDDWFEKLRARLSWGGLL